MTEALAYHILLNLKILIDKIGTILQVCKDTTDMCSGKDNCIRLFFIKELFYGHTIKKIQFFMRASYKISVTTTLQIIPDSGTYQTVVSRYIDFRILIHSYSSSLFIIHQFFHVKLLHKLHIMINHDFHQFRKRSLSWIPAK